MLARVATKREIGKYKTNKKNMGKITGFRIFVLYVSYLFPISCIFPRDFCKANLSLSRANITLVGHKDLQNKEKRGKLFMYHF